MARWDRISSRGNVEDRRGSNSPLAIGGGTIGIGGLLLLIALNYLTGGNLTDILNQTQVNPQVQNSNTTQYEGQDSYEVFASTVLGSNNDYWTTTFNSLNKNYRPPKLVLFRNATNSSCGIANSEIGPHYCPNDQTIYLDETFFGEMEKVLQAKGGDVAEAYVISHEVGHHAQNLLGIMDSVDYSNNQQSIGLELQADCFAGLWTNSIKDKDVLEFNEIQEAMDAASSVGDDRIQKTTEGRINPETWTHGSSAQRVNSFNSGFLSGNFQTCNTLSP